MRDLRGIAVSAGDVIVRGERSGSGTGELKVMLVVSTAVEVVREHRVTRLTVSAYKDGSKPYRYRAAADVLILPPEYADCLLDPKEKP